MAIRVALGGEGETPGAVNINLIRHIETDLTLTGERATTVTSTQTGYLIRATAAQLPLTDGCASEIVALRFPVQHDLTMDARPLIEVFRESFRALAPGATLSFQRASRNAFTDRSDANLMQQVGFLNVAITGSEVRGDK
jgi:hypothetical protein